MLELHHSSTQPMVMSSIFWGILVPTTMKCAVNFLTPVTENERICNNENSPLSLYGPGSLGVRKKNRKTGSGHRSCHESTCLLYQMPSHRPACFFQTGQSGSGSVPQMPKDFQYPEKTPQTINIHLNEAYRSYRAYKSYFFCVGGEGGPFMKRTLQVHEARLRRMKRHFVP